MSWLDRFRKPEPSTLTAERALSILRERGFWEPTAGTKAANNPRLYFPHFHAHGFAVDADPTLPDDKRTVLVIYSKQDMELFQDPSMMERAIQVGYCSPRVRGKQFVVVPRVAS